jgi:hypothetical protein
VKVRSRFTRRLVEAPVAAAEWEKAWADYIEKLERLDQLKRQGRYGYQLRMPKKSVDIAWQKLAALDPEFMARLARMPRRKEP